eukprot:8250193-Pyramimonas_sp.AAC.1
MLRLPALETQLSSIKLTVDNIFVCFAENGEGIQILHYEPGQKYEAHYDYFHDKFNNDPTKGGQRVATMLMYLYVIPQPIPTILLFRYLTVVDVGATGLMRCA